MKSYTITRTMFYEESGITPDRLRRAMERSQVEPPRPVMKTKQGERFLRSDFAAYVAELTCEEEQNQKTIEMMMVWLEDWT